MSEKKLNGFDEINDEALVGVTGGESKLDDGALANPTLGDYETGVMGNWTKDVLCPECGSMLHVTASNSGADLIMVCPYCKKAVVVKL